MGSPEFLVKAAQTSLRFQLREPLLRLLAMKDARARSRSKFALPYILYLTF
jgi:hypothetical protein